MNTAARRPLLFFLLIIFGIVLLRTAWVGDDAYITMRTVDNFVHGYGPTWNVAERVQTYTHPLWMLLLTIVYGLSQNEYLSMIMLSLIFSLSTMFIFLFHGTTDDFSGLIGWTILVFSNAFIDYSTSGLENPAAHMFVLMFTILYLKWNGQLSKNQVLAFGVLTALIALMRIDLLLFTMPVMLQIILAGDTLKRLAWVAIGFVPFILWEIFSIIYYGFPLPNTFYAKLPDSVSHGELLPHGILYLFNSIVHDPVTLIVIGTSITWSMWSGNKQQKIVSAGILLYLMYVIWIGGDFMSGRFLSTSILGSVAILVGLLNRVPLVQRSALFVLAMTIGLMARTPGYVVPPTPTYQFEDGISDEQAWFYPSTGLLHWERSSPFPNHKWAYEGRALQEQGAKVYIGKGIGFLGFNAGPGVHVIDQFALTDPLLAHLPVITTKHTFIGHFQRAIPEGYIETLTIGTNQIEDPGMALYYEKILLITRGELWSIERWKAIWMLNTGQYDHLLDL